MAVMWYRLIAKLWWWANPLTGFRLIRIIRDRHNDQPYMIRYYLCSTRWLERWFPQLSWRLCLHHIVQSDNPTIGLHNHPWSWARTRLLSGSYHEYTPEGRFWRTPTDGWRNLYGHSFHRIQLDPWCTEPVWSIFLMGPRQSEWGFVRDGQFVEWRTYLGLNKRTV